ncbi:aldehyde dehydrogenase family 3 member H1-like isoform X1 [Hibiscus syriacus]|uniref:aldehyde dehydrogenase family 3 member H1-like isoform X1 n=1 Tax=Hibiscus syriacus TaxID=106335 RepID=UPI001924AC92|nr:aldehyde dehydrogenase family 3 member H1-like isoform X1 [Hibiscus syriacus]
MMTIIVSVLSVLSLGPVIGAIAAGNAVVLKPSEIAPATSSLIARLAADYLDRSCIKVVERVVSETSALLEQVGQNTLYRSMIIYYPFYLLYLNLLCLKKLGELHFRFICISCSVFY